MDRRKSRLPTRARVIAALLASGVAGCPIFEDYELDEDPDASPAIGVEAGAPAPDDGGGGSSGETSRPSSTPVGNAPAGNGGTAPQNGAADCVPTAPVYRDSCPKECTGGCEDDVCTIDCRSSDACAAASVVCPADRPCRIDCGSCEKTRILCPGPRDCYVVCNGEASCKDARIACAAPLCELECDGKQACQRAVLACDTARCPTGCSPLESDDGVMTLECLTTCVE